MVDPLAYKNANDSIIIDESLFTHSNGIPQWIIGLINLRTNDIRLELVESRYTEILKTIITKHVITGNIIYTDSWNGYYFLSDFNSGYHHIKYNQSSGQFGLMKKLISYHK